jgi:hypothetical protein
MTKDELESVSRQCAVDVRNVEIIVHMLRNQGWIVVSPSERIEGEKLKWGGPPLDNEAPYFTKKRTPE